MWDRNLNFQYAKDYLALLFHKRVKSHMANRGNSCWKGLAVINKTISCSETHRSNIESELLRTKSQTVPECELAIILGVSAAD